MDLKKTLLVLRRLENRNDIWILIIAMVSFVLLRAPSLIEPYWYGDEGIYEVIGIALRQGRLLYGGIWDNKPPILYLLYALFNGDQFYVRLLSLIFGFFSVIVFFEFCKKLFRSSGASLISTLVFSFLFATPFLEGNIANAENFMLLPILLAFLIVVVFKEKSNVGPFFIAGILMSVAFLTKIVALFDFAALFLFMLVIKFQDAKTLQTFLKYIYGSFAEGNFFRFYEKEIAYVIGFVSPIILVSVYFLLKGAFTSYIQAVFFQNIGYVGYNNFFFFPLGFLGFKIFLMLIMLGILIYFRLRLLSSGILIYLWILFGLFSAFFSQRPYTHYLLMLLIPICLLGGLVIDQMRLRLLNVLTLIVLLLLVFYFFRPYNKVVAYYVNYFEFMSGAKSINSYRIFFDRNAVRDYHMANFIKAYTNPSDSIFLWSDSGQIYALSNKLPLGRYIVAYHMLSDKAGISETEKLISANNPRFIIATKDTSPIDRILQSYHIAYIIDSAYVYEREL